MAAFNMVEKMWSNVVAGTELMSKDATSVYTTEKHWKMITSKLSAIFLPETQEEHSHCISLKRESPWKLRKY